MKLNESSEMIPTDRELLERILAWLTTGAGRGRAPYGIVADAQILQNRLDAADRPGAGRGAP